MMGQTDCIYLLSHCAYAPSLAHTIPLILVSWLYCGCAELTFLLLSSSFCVDIHINYQDCEEHLSVTTLLSIVSACVIINDLIRIKKPTYGKCGYAVFVTLQD